MWIEQDLPIDSVGIVFDLVHTRASDVTGGIPFADSPVLIGSVFPNGRKEKNLKGWKILRASFGFGKTIIFSQDCPLSFEHRREMGDMVKEFMDVKKQRMLIRIKRVPRENRVNPLFLEFEVECSFPTLDRGVCLDLRCQLV